MNKFAAGSLGAVTVHRIKCILSGRSAVEPMRQRQQALQAEQIMDGGPKRVSPISAFQIIETKEGGMMVIVITTTQVTQMHDIVKTLKDGPESAKEILWTPVGVRACGWEKSLRKHGKTTLKYRVTRPLQHVVTISVEAKTSTC